MLRAVFAVRLPFPRPVEPFGDLPGGLAVLDSTLAEAQARALSTAGYTLRDVPPTGESYLAFGAELWFTASLLRKLTPGRLLVTDDAFLRATANLQSFPRRPRLGIVPAGGNLESLADVPIDLGLKPVPSPTLHPAFRHAAEVPIVAGACAVHAVEHWTHLVRVNLLALAARVEEAKASFETAPFWAKLWGAVTLLWKAGSIQEAAIARALSRIGPACKIHPTAVVEASELGARVTVGPHAVIRGCVIGEGAQIDAHAHVVASAIGAGAQIGRGTHLALSVCFPGALVSQGAGFQACVFGRDCFVAQGVTALDLSFGRPISVMAAGERVSTDGWFLGSAIGHRARIGAGVRLGYGVAVPNDTLLVGPADALLRVIEPVDGPATVRAGRMVSARDSSA